MSISVSNEDLAVLKRHAKRIHGGNVSAVIHELTTHLRREEAAAKLLDMLGGESISDAEVNAITDEVATALTRG